jgi:uncharacterized protein (DUF736 family)
MSERDPNELGALWEKTSSKGTKYLSGTINGVRVVCFRATKQSEKQPDWRVLKSQERGAAPRQDDDSDIGF